ncbi:hypothetical protein LXL04_014523 [Taraxacum kok-saghyz]
MTPYRKILLVAYAGQGHIIPALRFANRLLKLGVHVTFSTSVSMVRRIEKETIPHGLTFAPFSDGHDDGKQETTSLQQFQTDFATYGASAIAEIISTAAAGGDPFDHLVYTTTIPWVARVANAQGLISGIKNNEAFPINLPGLLPLTTADLPSFILPSHPKELDFIKKDLKGHIEALKISPRILVNTFNELEVESIRAIDKLEFLPIGPLIPSEYFDEKNSSENSLGKDFFDRTEDDCIQWLNTKPKSSVVYVSFGTLANLSMDQLEEVAIGLLECRRPFLWVIRDSEQAGRLSKIEELNKQGMIVGWCSQVVVLRHQAIGCFVMHGGWNSTTEALVAGVPTVVFPQWSDQCTNAKMMEDVWRTGVRVKRREGDGVVEGKEIERCVEMVMGDEDMKRNAIKWRELAREALSDGGTSSINLQVFLDNI